MRYTIFVSAMFAAALAVAGTPPESLWLASEVDFEAASSARFAAKGAQAVEKVDIRLSPGAWLDGSFVMSRGQPALMCLLMKGQGKFKAEFEEIERLDRASRRAKPPVNRLLFEFDLPDGVSMLDVADGELLSAERTPSGTHCKCAMIADFDMGLSRIPDDYNWWRKLGFLISAEAPVSAEAKVYVTWDGRRISNVETVKLRMMGPVRAAERPKRFRFGVSTGGIYPNFHESGWRKWAGFCREAGLNTMTPDLRDREKRDWQIDVLRDVGFSWVLPVPPPDTPLYNGYCIGPSAGRPESDRFVTDPGEYARLPEARRKALDNAVCPSAVYERRPFFMTNTLPKFAAAFAKVDGVWCNWEPFAYMGRGCFCDVCRRKFAEFAGMDEASLKAEWPKAVMRKGRLEDAFVKFSSREHGRMLKVVNEEIGRMFMGGRGGFGFMPGVAWCEMASMWRTNDYAKSVRPIEYAAAFEWVSPWGPYAIWPSQQPYEYSKWRNLRTFLAAKDVRAQVDADYPLPRRPKLMAYPHGFQCQDWLIRPEALEMNIDAFFFNGWESVVVYHFPKGYDQRWWAAIARCAEKQARYEGVVLGGGRRDDSRAVLELTAPYAAPNPVEGTATRGLEIRKPMLQHVVWEKDGRTVVAVFNFWEKAPAFFRLTLDGKDLGEFVCGALRTAVFEFGADGRRIGGPSSDEVAGWRRALMPRLKAAKAGDDAFERKISGKSDDSAQALEQKMYQPGKADDAAGVPDEFPHTAVKDSSAFTAKVKLQIDGMQKGKPIPVIRQTTPKTGWLLGLVDHGERGVLVEIFCNGAYLTAGWIDATRQRPGSAPRKPITATLTLAARKGLIVVYLDGKVLRRFHDVITPNLEPVKVWHGGGGVKVLSVEFLGPEVEYYAPGESREPAEGFKGGVGWLVSCPPEKPGVNLPRILCYGDSVLSGYGKHLRRVLEGRAYVYTWGGFVSDPNVAKFNPRKFREAASVKPFDFIVFNNGLHSLHWTVDKVPDAQVKEVQRGICRAFREAVPRAKVFWLSTTPHTSRARNAAGKVEAFGDLNGMVQRINRLSAEVMREESVPVLDAYSLLAAHLDLAAGDAYHWTGEGYALLSEFIAKGLGLTPPTTN